MTKKSPQINWDKPRGMIIAAPASNAGKTVITLALLRAIKNAGIQVTSAKIGPDYIDPTFHSQATGTPSFSLDTWAMRKQHILHSVNQIIQNKHLIIIEGVMGLFDGAHTKKRNKGDTAELARMLKLPVILVVNTQSMGASIAPLIYGFHHFHPRNTIEGVILNKVASQKHEEILRNALKPLSIPVIGAIRTDENLALPERHLGLIQAGEIPNIHLKINQISQTIEKYCDIDAVLKCARQLPNIKNTPNVKNTQCPKKLPPLGQKIAIANDRAFGFIYHHIIWQWKQQGVEILPFSPLKNQSPDKQADAIFLPGGYPELHCQTIAQNTKFLDALKNAAKKNTLIYGECGGFMILGNAIIDAQGNPHKMTGLLPFTTSFNKPKRTMGYRQLMHISPLPFPKYLRGHEFHYSTLKTDKKIPSLFQNAQDAQGNSLEPMGAQMGSVMGSYAHIIDIDPQRRK